MGRSESVEGGSRRRWGRASGDVCRERVSLSRAARCCARVCSVPGCSRCDHGLPSSATAATSGPAARAAAGPSALPATPSRRGPLEPVPHLETTRLRQRSGSVFFHTG